MAIPQSTVILGAGIIGVSTAYYLSQSVPGSSIHLIDTSPEFFASASGKAGGFLAADWFGPASAPLGLLSFKLHKQLSDEYDGGGMRGVLVLHLLRAKILLAMMTMKIVRRVNG
jgi:glycine/D-amino acid oxidase-like deaminating enzyme